MNDVISFTAFGDEAENASNLLSRNQISLREHKGKLMLKGLNYAARGKLNFSAPLPNLFVVPKAIIHKVMEIKTW